MCNDEVSIIITAKYYSLFPLLLFLFVLNVVYC